MEEVEAIMEDVEEIGKEITHLDSL